MHDAQHNRPHCESSKAKLHVHEGTNETSGYERTGTRRDLGQKAALDHERLEKAFVGHIAVTGVRRDQIQVTKELSLRLLANGFGGLGKIVQVTFVHLCSCQPRSRSLRVSSWVAYLAGYYDKNVIGQILERDRHDECASVHRK